MRGSLAGGQCRVGSAEFLYYNNFAPAMPAAFPNYWFFFETRAISSSNRESKSFRIADLFDFL